MSDDTLSGETAVVTGAGSGIGASIASELAAAGASVIVAEIDKASGESTARSIRDSGGEGIFVETDVTDAASAETLMAAVEAEYGGPDVLVNNAGGELNDGKAHEVDPDTWRANIDLNLTSPFLCTRAALPRMIDGGGGRIVHVSSVNGLTGIGLTGYSAAKAGIHGLSRLVATQYSGYGIRSNVVCPGTIDTGSRRAHREAEWDDAVWTQLKDQYPGGRFGRPEEVASAVRFLASDRSSFVNGVVLPVDGGMTAGLDRTFERTLYETDSYP
ncbi:SDR family NAD(P)-dependent oxidoreductase [Halosolutus gelatinilyticus]|uniref:SDR family NAD(P)-dependent oxidoreductase n=1 Tax=Halosolutus gelatinilyticus TaxID=2931975 RepID=UPI001FF6D159|nr:SDR family NAD(P)-dependent oxidoreductase [Halosolutus gelatinilyticus]